MYSNNQVIDLKKCIHLSFVRENLKNELKQKEYYLKGNDPKIVKKDLQKEVEQLKKLIS